MTDTTASTDQIGPPPPYDPELAESAAVFAEVMPSPTTPNLISAFRSGPTGVEPSSGDELSRGGEFQIFERTVPGPAGESDITLLVCRPTGASAPTPAIYAMHGGGMILGDRRTNLPDMVDLAASVGAAVISVEYRLAPEHPHPAPIEDCYAGLVWVAANATELNIDPGRLVVAGASSGGGLAAAVALLARDRGGPELAGQLLLAPMLDDRDDTPSVRQMASRDMWDHTLMDSGWTALLGDARGGPDVSPYAAPARATDLSGLPPAFIYGGSVETVRDEDVAYASAIWRAGGQAELHVWSGGFHGFDLMAPQAAVSQAAKAARTSWMRRIVKV
ncbi:alpha/beta hydrolase [Rugosimonospora africana]|uniref:Esterase n=1 Tax=Rugosimonospora africana TaxID=556532 RepID=A0A8J3QY36_9ACTN|nr:alpha/beta hydrolase [Rugosimonospora africana]GIH16791.1 esterase [Rugosimonospora africana]